MLNFVEIVSKKNKSGTYEVYPEFELVDDPDFIRKGGKFYAVWNESTGMWSTKESVLYRIVDKAIDEKVKELRAKKGEEASIAPMHMKRSGTGSADRWHHFVEKICTEEHSIRLDTKLIFSNMETTREDYITRKLKYPLVESDCPAYDRLMSVIYEPKERHKLEWCVGAVVAGKAHETQKFAVLYGAPGSGKSTFLNILNDMFSGYCAQFNAKSLASSADFALEAFRNNPLFGIQHDGDLSRVEDNTRLNSLVSHETMLVNEKFKSQYEMQFDTMLFMGTNSLVQITDSQSGLVRRLIDVEPSNNILPRDEYDEVMARIKHEYSGIAWRCMNVFLEDQRYYDHYVPKGMIQKTNDFYGYIETYCDEFKENDGVTLKKAWELYKKYEEGANVKRKISMRECRVELESYFEEYYDVYRMPDGMRVRKYFKGFKDDESFHRNRVKLSNEPDWLEMKKQTSKFDIDCANCTAQYANEKTGGPKASWDNVTTTLREVDTDELHYVRVPENHIVIDFDIPDESGEKSFKLNYEAAKKWPPTYAELSKSGAGIHLHYIYDGDLTNVSNIYDDHIEIKIYRGKSALRRKLSKCNALDIAHYTAALPLKELKGEGVVNFTGFANDQAIRTYIKNAIANKYGGGTYNTINMISDALDKAYESGMTYDVREQRQALLSFALKSSHHPKEACKKVMNMRLASEDVPEYEEAVNDRDVFFDCEVFPNLFIICYMFADDETEHVYRMINPSPEEVEELCKYSLIGFNNRRYDNHILYGRMQGFTNEELFNLSQRIVNGDRDAMFSGAYSLSKTDIYDFASAGNKQSLKKWEIALGIHHEENAYPWDQPLDESHWNEVTDYCCNDVMATKAVFMHLQADWIARQILADLAEGSVNDSTNSLTTKIIFGKNKNPQSEFCYRDMSKPVTELDPDVHAFLKEACPEMMAQKHGPNGESLLPYFPGYKFDCGKSTYKGWEVGEGGLAHGWPGVYGNVALLDVSSMHPHSTIAECLFGVRYTQAYRDIVEGRVSIKHKAWDEVSNMLDGKLVPYIKRVQDGEFTAKDLANALKTAINSVYGLTAAKFENPFRDERNIDNIVAKRGALFMVDLIEFVHSKGFKVAHVKTDSIKIPDATPEIIQEVMDFGLKYGYTFEHEATYDRICLLNDAVYIAKGKDGDHAGEWTATGTQFAVPYVFKTLFSGEPIVFEDMCETKSATTALYLDFDENLPFGEHDRKFIGKVGNFCPMKPGCGGGVLVRETEDKKNGGVKYTAVAGTKRPDKTPYRWMEAETVRALHLEDQIDKSYYQILVDASIEDIDQYADVEWFRSDVPYDINNNGILPF